LLSPPKRKSSTSSGGDSGVPGGGSSFAKSRIFQELNRLGWCFIEAAPALSILVDSIITPDLSRGKLHGKARSFRSFELGANLQKFGKILRPTRKMRLCGEKNVYNFFLRDSPNSAVGHRDLFPTWGSTLALS
jgi:hypothetical protein